MENNYTIEEQSIIDQAKANGTYLKAPNGEDSNLSPKQWVQVRTNAFKEWFGDWQNDPGDASKILDNNGEPALMYHGSKSDFSVFDIEKSGNSNKMGEIGFWFSPMESFAQNFANDIWWGDNEQAIIYNTFLSLKNPKIYENKEIGKEKESLEDELFHLRNELSIIRDKWSNCFDWQAYESFLISMRNAFLDEETKKYYANNSPESMEAISDGERVRELLKKEKDLSDKLYELIYNDPYELLRTDLYRLAGMNAEDANIAGTGMVINNENEVLEEFKENLRLQGFDGIIIKGTRYDKPHAGGILNDQYVALYPNQIKSAIENNGEFSIENNDILFRDNTDESKVQANNGRRQRHGFRGETQRRLTVDESYQLEKDKFRNADSSNEYATVLKRNDSWRGAVNEFYMLAQQSRDTADSWKNREYKANKNVVIPTENTRYADEYAPKTTIEAANERRRLSNIASLENKAKEYEEFANTLCDRIGAQYEKLPGINNTLFREVLDNYTQEEQFIINQAKANGTYLKAPNGEDSNLSPKQWIQVRTTAFKEWFGDWQNNPDVASKFLDKNGEPIVVYHGTPLSRNQITPNSGWQRDGLTYISQTPPFNTFKGGAYSGLIFTSESYDKAANIAEKRAMNIPDDENGNEQFSSEGYVYSLYLNSKNPFDAKNEQVLNEILDSFNGDIPTLGFYGGKGSNISKEEAIAIIKREANSWIITETPEFIDKIKALGYDGLVGMDEWVKYMAVFDPNQLKSAIDNSGKFSSLNNDIRYRFIGDKGAANLDRAEEATIRLDNLAIAHEMEFVGKDALSIKIATGWERGADDKWRYEDSDLRVNDNVRFFKSENGYYSLMLSELNGDDRLFDEYPELAGISVTIKDGVIEKAFLNDSKIEITGNFVNEGQLLPDKKNTFENILSHEIQHAIQDREGFARGGSPEEFKDTKLEVLRDINFFTDGDFLKGSTITDTNSIREALEKKSTYLNSTIAEIYGDKLQRVAVKYGYSDINQLIDSYESLPSALGQYHKLSGEVEARNVQSRMHMTPEERRNSLARLTEDVRWEDQIFLKEAFSGSIYSPKAEFVPAIKSLSNSLHVPIDVISDIDELPDSVAKRRIEAGRDIKGWFVPRTNNVTIYLPNISSLDDAYRTVLHEAVAHYGLRKMFGDHFDNFLDNVYNNASSEIQGKIMYATHGEPAKRLVATEEYLAKLAEKGFHNQQEVSLWKKAKFAFIDMLHQAGVKLGFKLHDNDLRGILYKSYLNQVMEASSNNTKILNMKTENNETTLKAGTSALPSEIKDVPSTKIKLVVYKGHTLGYILPELPNSVQILHSSPLKGANSTTNLQDNYHINNLNEIRLASDKDFDDFNVDFKGYDDKEVYEYSEGVNTHKALKTNFLDDEFKTAVEGEDYKRLSQLNDGGYVPTKELIKSLSNNASSNSLVAIQKIFGLNSMGDSLTEVETLQGWLCERKVSTPSMSGNNNLSID